MEYICFICFSSKLSTNIIFLTHKVYVKFIYNITNYILHHNLIIKYIIYVLIA